MKRRLYAIQYNVDAGRHIAHFIGLSHKSGNEERSTSNPPPSLHFRLKEPGLPRISRVQHRYRTRSYCNHTPLKFCDSSHENVHAFPPFCFLSVQGTIRRKKGDRTKQNKNGFRVSFTSNNNKRRRASHESESAAAATAPNQATTTLGVHPCAVQLFAKR